MLVVEQSTNYLKMMDGVARHAGLEQELRLEQLKQCFPDLDGLATASIDSTNEALKRLLRQPYAGTFGPLLLIADSQTKGRGRGGNAWYSVPGASLLMTLALPMKPVEPLLPFAAALAVYNGIIQQLPVAAEDLVVKWPNDLIWSGRKLSGILCESVVSSNHSYALVGIGVNVLQHDFPPEFSRPVSLEEIAKLHEEKQSVSRGPLLLSIYRELQRELTALSTLRGKSTLLDRYRERCGTLGQAVTWYTINNIKRYGHVKAVTDDGRLEVRTTEGRTELLTVADIREVRPGGEER